MKKIITGITVEEQMRKAKEILETIIIPRNEEFLRRKDNFL